MEEYTARKYRFDEDFCFLYRNKMVDKRMLRSFIFHLFICYKIDWSCTKSNDLYSWVFLSFSWESSGCFMLVVGVFLFYFFMGSFKLLLGMLVLEYEIFFLDFSSG